MRRCDAPELHWDDLEVQADSSVLLHVHRSKTDSEDSEDSGAVLYISKAVAAGLGEGFRGGRQVLREERRHMNSEETAVVII